MGYYDRLMIEVLSGTKDHKIPFDSICNLLKHCGFSFRVKGSHHIFYREDIPEIINIQPKGSNAKPYQVKQVRQLFLKYKLGVIDNV